MHPRELTERITLLTQTVTEDAHGQRVASAWFPLPADAQVWAKTGNASSRDIAFAGAHQATVDAKLIIRHRTDLPADLRVLWAGATYEVVGLPAPLAGGREWLEIRCRRLPA